MNRWGKSFGRLDHNMKGGRSRVISPILPSVSIMKACSMLTIYALMNVRPRLCMDTLKQYMHYECRTYVVKSKPQFKGSGLLPAWPPCKNFKMAIIQNFASDLKKKAPQNKVHNERPRNRCTFITSLAKEVMLLVALVCLFVCLWTLLKKL